jgi:AraC family transcriptional regulator
MSFYEEEKMETVRIYEIPDCKMVSSGIGMFGEEKFGRFNAWFSSLPRSVFPRDFLFWDGEYGVSGGFHWLYLYDDSTSVPDEFAVIDFKGGLYAVVTDIDQKDNTGAMKARDEFLASHGLEIDRSRPELGNIITSPLGEKALGYNQMDYYTPVKGKGAP